MALTNLKTLWVAAVLVKLRATIVFGSPLITNRNYQGVITQAGDRVKVVGMADPTIFDVSSNADIPAPETLTDESAEMVIDISKGFNFQVDDLDQLRNPLPGITLMSVANAARRLAEVADGTISAKMVAGVDAANVLGDNTTPLEIAALTPGATVPNGQIDPYTLLVKLGIKLDKQNVPSEGRWAVIPPFLEGALRLDPRFTAPNDGAVLRNGFIGSAAGFLLFKTNALPTATGAKYKVIAGHSMATSYAEQLVQVEFYRPERRFADAVKGRHVYGHKVFYPKALTVATVHDSSGLDA